MYFFPCVIGGHGLGSRKIIDKLVVYNIIGGLLLAYSTVGIHGHAELIAEHTVRSPKLKIIDKRKIAHEIFLADTPCGRCRRKETVTIAGKEARRAVVTSVHFEKIAVVEVIVHTKEETEQLISRCTTLSLEFVADSKIEIVQRFG